jgi:predicted P-loop ATPase
MNKNSENNPSSNKPKKSVLKLVDENTKEKEVTTVFHKVESDLNENYDLRFNKIALDIESSKKDEGKWDSCNDNSLWVEIQKKGIKIGHSALKAILKSDFVPKYNPFKDYFTNLPQWDGETDYISQYAEYLKLDPSEDKLQFLYHFKKWCVRAVKCAISKHYFNKQAFIITDDGKGQNIGKSTWCRTLCPSKLSKYIAEDISHNDKDTRILICKNFLINLDELAVLSKKEINQLKSLFSKNQINDRLPYESKNSIIPRVASFIGSTNMSTFLHDETGSVRWLCFLIKDIDWSYKSNFNMDLLWSQAYNLSMDSNFMAEMTREDIQENEKRNEKFQFLTAERESLNEYFEPTNSKEGEHLTATKIRDYIKARTSLPVNSIQIGKALKTLGFERIKVNSVYGYYVKYRPLI